MRTEFRLVLAASLLVTACGSEDLAESTRSEAPATQGQARSGALQASGIVVGEQLSCVVGNTTSCRGGNPFLRWTRAGDPASALDLGLAADQLTIGDHHACVLIDGTVSCWGSNLMGQLGPAETTATCIDRPCSHDLVSIAGLSSIREIAAGGFHTLALAEDGSVWGWGANSFAQAGGATQPIQKAPRRVQGIETAVSVAAAGLQSYAVLSDGSVVAWGNAGSGRLGSETDDPFVSKPTRVEGLSGPVVQVTSGAAHACALLKDGSVECWGDNRFGQLGDGTTDARSEAHPVTDPPDVVSVVVAGGHFTCALDKNGQVTCWGWNDNGQLGQGSVDGPEEPEGFSASTRPVQVRGLPGPARSLSAGPGFACVLIDGAAWCWGRNEAGQLGDAGLLDNATPVKAGRRSSPSGTVAGRELSKANNGLDVSYHSGRVDWEKVASQNFGFAFTLSTAGEDFHDPSFDSHWRRMNRIRRGAYHFFVAHDDPAKQALWFIANTPLEAGDLAPVVDIETLGDDPPDDLPDRLEVFVDIVHRHFGIKPIVYTGPTFWDRNFGDGWGDHALWVAEYEVSAPKVPTGWQSWALWQHSGNASLEGVERVVDLNRIADGFDLDRLAIPASGRGFNSKATADRR